MENYISFIKKRKIFFLGLLVLVWVVYINVFPQGYVISSSDSAQFINMKENFLNDFLTIPSYLISFLAFYFFDSLNFSNSSQLSLLLGFFIFGSYLSFYVFTGLFFQNASDKIRSAVSIFYSLNLYTLYIFTMHSLGYTWFFSLYIFIPILIGTFVKFLSTRKFIFLSYFCLTLFLASPGFGNPAFALSLGIFLFLTVIFSVIVKAIPMNKELVLKLAVLIVLSACISSFWLLPVIPQMRSGVESLYTTNATDLFLALKQSASPIMNSLSLNHYSYDYFPFNFPYPKLFFLRNFLILATFLPIIIILTVFIFSRKAIPKMAYVALAVFLFLLVLVGKGAEPFGIINYLFFFKVWGINTLRGYDKTAIYIPFALSIFLLLSLIYLEKTRWKKIINVAIFVIIITPLPFFLGKIQQNMGLRYASLSPEKKNYKTAKLTFLVKIPEEYFQLKPFLNNQSGVFFISTLPYNMGDSGTGASNYPKWKLNGVDITQRLYNKKFVEANFSYFPGWYPGRDFSESDYDPVWMVKALGLMDVKYIIYHKDAPDGSIRETQEKISKLENQGDIKLIKDNDYFSLYEIDSQYILPYISYQKEEISMLRVPFSIGRNFNKIKDYSSQASFQENNPKKFTVNFSNSANSKNIVLAEPFNPLWKAYAVSGNGQKKEMKNHFIARGYANGWKIDDPENTKKIVIEYYPIKLMWYGLVMSLVTALILMIYLLKYHYGHKKSVENH